MAVTDSTLCTLETEWLRFVPYEPPKGQTTPRWAVASKSGGDTLGLVKFFGRWRCYVFYPNYATIYNAGCLGDIGRFCERQTQEWASRVRRR